MDDVEAETMTALTPRDVSGQNEVEAGDGVEDLRNSLREAVHDDTIQPKMQCLMMDSSFSMVTMQGEDSGIAWETTPSRCATPWATDAGNPAVDVGAPVAVQPATSGSVPAGKIIFLMDEELMSRRRTTKERADQKTSRRPAESSEDVSGRPELVEVSQPNVKMEDVDEEEAHDPLFSLVSEGSEILNIVVPQKMATVDEEESKDMVDNLSYLEDSLIPKASEETQDSEVVLTGSDHAEALSSPRVMDPPGAPVARPPGRGTAGNVDYFEAFSLIDTPAPGSPAVIAQGRVERDAEVPEIQEAEGPKDDTTTTTVDKSDTISLVEIASELLDEVFYGGTDGYAMKPLHKDGGRGAPSRLPSKPSGSTLFGSQEDILTPIFLPEGPPKIIDQILLEEPKAMAFLYSDLYEEAVGSRKKEEDTESLTSEKSFHSRHSDREARGYLEKFVLIDESPALEVEPVDKKPAEGPRVLTQDLYDYGDLISKPEKTEMPNSEEEITDFFRSSANSSPCELEPYTRALEEDDETTKDTTKKSVSVKVEKVPVDPLCVSDFEFISEEPDWGGLDDHPGEKEVATDQELWKQKMQKPVAPPRRKAASSPKERLDLTPLIPVDFVQEEEEEEEEAGGKETRVEEKETASPAETADEGDGEEATLSSADLLENVSAAVESPQTDEVFAAAAEEKDSEEREMRRTEAAEADVQSSETEVYPEKQGAKEKGQCVIL